VRVCVLVCLLFACEKVDDVAALRQEAAELGSSAQAEVDALDARVQAVNKRGLKLRALPGNEAADKLVRDATVDLGKLHAKLADRAQAAAGATTQAKLEQIVREYSVLEAGSDGTPVPPELMGIHADGTALSTAESWVTHAEAEMAHGSAAPR
jgi:hypothetical protein